jgi:hypothetical protein
MSFDISTKAAVDTFDVPLIDPATGEALIGDGGQPCSVSVHGPGTREYAAAKSAASNRAIKRFKAKGKAETTPEEEEAAVAAFLTAITTSFNGFTYKGLPNEPATFRQLYLDRSLGWITDQVNQGAGDWGNFSKASETN